MISRTIIIKALPSIVWSVLTDPELIKRWISDYEVSIQTNWKEQNLIIFRGDLHGITYENTGTILQFIPDKVLTYTHLSSLSQLPDVPENHSIIEFRLTPLQEQTVLTLIQSNFATETIFKHWEFYWNVTLDLLKKTAEIQ
jgi:uncharacterized protein YndB with AHSA1/START domain